MRFLCSVLILLAASPLWAADAPKLQLPRLSDISGPMFECVFLFETAGVPSSTPGDCRALNKWQPSQVGVLLAQSTWYEATVIEAEIGSEAWLPVAATACAAGEIQYGDACVADPGGEGSSQGAMDILTGGLF